MFFSTRRRLKSILFYIMSRFHTRVCNVIRILKLCDRRIVMLIFLCLISTLLVYFHAQFLFVKNDKAPRIVFLSSARFVVNKFVKNIFFIDNSERGGLSPKAACSVEAAARANRDWKINVLFTNAVTDSSVMLALRPLGNINYGHILTKKFAKKTPLKALVDKNKKLSHDPDFLKFLTLFHYGGIYVDFNILMLRSFTEKSKNWVVRMKRNVFSGSIFALSMEQAGRNLSGIMVRQLILTLRKKHEEGLFNNIGNEVVTEALKKYCSTSYVPFFTKETCKEIEIFDNKKFPLAWMDMKEALLPGSLYKEMNNPYVYNMQENIHIAELIKANFPSLAEQYCPVSYEIFGYDGFM